jgi:hypothetical protein
VREQTPAIDFVPVSPNIGNMPDAVAFVRVTDGPLRQLDHIYTSTQSNRVILGSAVSMNWWRAAKMASHFAWATPFVPSFP